MHGLPEFVFVVNSVSPLKTRMSHAVWENELHCAARVVYSEGLDCAPNRMRHSLLQRSHCNFGAPELVEQVTELSSSGDYPCYTTVSKAFETNVI